MAEAATLHEYGILFAWRPNSSVAAFLERNYSNCKLPAFMLVALLDSTPVGPAGRAVEISRSLELRGVALSAGLLVSTEDIAATNRNLRAVFVGFDSVYLFASRPDCDLLVPPRLTSEIPITNRGWNTHRGELAAWMKRFKCPLALGDGIGLNSAAVDHSFEAD